MLKVLRWEFEVDGAALTNSTETQLVAALPPVSHGSPHAFRFSYRASRKGNSRSPEPGVSSQASKVKFAHVSSVYCLLMRNWSHGYLQLQERLRKCNVAACLGRREGKNFSGLLAISTAHKNFSLQVQTNKYLTVYLEICNFPNNHKANHKTSGMISMLSL